MNKILFYALTILLPTFVFGQTLKKWNVEAIVRLNGSYPNQLSGNISVLGGAIERDFLYVRNTPISGISASYAISTKWKVGFEITQFYMAVSSSGRYFYNAFEYHQVRVLPVVNYSLLKEIRSWGSWDVYASGGLGYRHTFLYYDSWLIEDKRLELLLQLPISMKTALGVQYVMPVGLFLKGELSMGGPLVQCRLGYAF